MIYLYILNNWVVATQYFLLSPRTLGKMNPFWLICFKWVGSTTNQTTVWAPFFFEKWLQVELGPQGIDCVSIWPGVVYTEFVQSLWPLGGRWWLRWRFRWIPGTPKSNHVLFHGWKWWSTNIFVFYVSWVGNHHPIERTNKKWTFPKIGGKHPKWMVNIMENPIV